MNAKTVKLIRKFARETKLSYESVKAVWNNTPERFRNELRNALKNDSTAQKSTIGGNPAA